MPSRTVFLARLIGLYCIVVSLAMLIRRQASVDVLTAMLHNAQLLLSLGGITVIAGLAMVLSHNVWSGGAVTVVGWIALNLGGRQGGNALIAAMLDGPRVVTGAAYFSTFAIASQSSESKIIRIVG